MIRLTVWPLVLTVLFISGCKQADDVEDIQGDFEEEREPSIATANIKSELGKTILVTMINTKGEKIGEAKLVQQSDGVKISLVATNLSPGIHGFHIHEQGVCQPPTFGSAEGHFNPTKSNHGFDDPEGPHAGDLTNIKVEEDGTVSVTMLAEMVTLEEGKKNSLLKEGGSSLMIHEQADDYQSQPSGDAGERIACGVITE